MRDAESCIGAGVVLAIKMQKERSNEKINDSMFRCCALNWWHNVWLFFHSRYNTRMYATELLCVLNFGRFLSTGLGVGLSCRINHL